MMDSGNSGSMQSSSGGDDQELDSRGDQSISSFFNPSPSSISGAAPHHPSFLSPQNPTFFDHSHLSHNQQLHHHHHHHHPTQYNNDNNDLIWSSGLRSQHINYANFPNSSSPSTTQSFAQAGPFPAGPSSSEAQTASRAPSVTKNPKKRTRASRRAPTTVLTTDTSNFRQMVQEFTGIPAAPFSASPYSRRLDLFSAASALRAGGPLDTLGPLYPLRPSAQKLPSPFSSTPPSLLNSTSYIGNTSNNHNTATAHGGSTWNNNQNQNNYPLSSSGEHHLLNLQHGHSINQVELGANNGSMNLGNLQSGFLSREGASSGGVRNNDDENVSRWTSGETVMTSNDGVEENVMVVPFDGNINISSSDSQHMSGYNLNLAEKGMENVTPSATQGTVASWICPSD
ncbi:hypothetical protein DH2020_007750 [Rehmannia glutinosa]|uniref:VQ domain-containing protein n=1 Tax=Rehmannia glutinosa TaxID=99300 RepID=A0ABR0TZV8_REHGL